MTSPVVSRPWLVGARVRTLPAAVVPVVVGTATVLADDGRIVWWRAAAAMLVALAIQVGTNFANDYHDGIKGTDDARVGPLRLTASGVKPASQVRAAALLSFLAAAAAGLTLAAATTWWLVLVGAVSFVAGWLYTGGPRPYGYFGLGEVFVFTFFGVVATVGSAFVHTQEITRTSLLASIPVGALATALLVINNLRDIPTDAIAGKRTLAVRLGDAHTRNLYVVLVSAAILLAPWAHPTWLVMALVALTIPLAFPPVRAVKSAATGPALIPVLVATGRLQLAFGMLYALGLWLS